MPLDEAGAKYAQHVREIAERVRRSGGLAGFIAESLPSVGGQIVFPDGYLAAAYADGVCPLPTVNVGNHFA